MSTTIIARPFEEEALFNAAFVSVLLFEAIRQYYDRSGKRPMPVILPYLLAPLALHRPTRDRLPNRINAQMGEWVHAHPELLVDLGERARSLRPVVSVGICFGLRHGVLQNIDGNIRAGQTQRRPRGMARSADVDSCISSAGFLGRWFAHQGDATTILAIWGLRV
jgi:hypothetical protein